MKYFQTKKELAAAIQRNPRFVRDMERGGLRLPVTQREVVRFLRNNPHPTRFRKVADTV
jgi:hypothetical protein